MVRGRSFRASAQPVDREPIDDQAYGIGVIQILNRTLFMLAMTTVTLLGGCQSLPLGESSQFPAAVTGTVFYLEQQPLPPEAIVYIRLQDITHENAPSLTVAAETINPPERVPVPFEISFEPSIIDPRHTYAIEAQIFEGDELLYTNPKPVLVLTGGKPSDVAVRVTPVEKHSEKAE